MRGERCFTTVPIDAVQPIYDDGEVFPTTALGKDLKVELSDKTAVAMRAVKLAKNKAGDAVGATAKTGLGGTLTALEVHVSR